MGSFLLKFRVFSSFCYSYIGMEFLGEVEGLVVSKRRCNVFVLVGRKRKWMSMLEGL